MGKNSKSQTLWHIIVKIAHIILLGIDDLVLCFSHFLSYYYFLNKCSSDFNNPNYVKSVLAIVFLILWLGVNVFKQCW